MAGHSHWSNIQHKKAAKDKKKGKILSRLAKLIYTAVKEGGGGKPEENPRLRLVLDKCRQANMPKENVKRAIDRAAAPGGGYDPMTFEGYAQDGVAVVVECLTDNTQRTAPDIRFIFDRNGGKLGKQGEKRVDDLIAIRQRRLGPVLRAGLIAPSCRSCHCLLLC